MLDYKRFLWFLLLLLNQVYDSATESMCTYTFGERCFALKSGLFGSWWEARGECKKAGMEVASILSSEEQLYLTQVIWNETSSQSGKRPKEVYIGLTDVTGAREQFQWIDNKPLNFTNLFTPVASYYTDDRRCSVLQSSGGDWVDDKDEKKWEGVPCCFPLGVTNVLCANPLGSVVEGQGSEVETYCVGACPKGAHLYKEQCYWINSMTSANVDVTQVTMECQKLKADILGYSSEDEDFFMYALTSFATEAGSSKVELFLKPVDTVEPATCQFFTWKSGGSSAKDAPCCKKESLEVIACKKPVGSDIVIDWSTNSMAKDCYPAMNPCDSSPCNNNGTCSVTQPLQPAASNNNYTCSCLEGYNGTHCETLWNHCLSSPCMNEGTCTPTHNASAYTFKCTCPPLFTGKSCESDYDPVDECLSNPCIGGICVNLKDMYRCDCDPGKTGINCDQDVVCPVLSVIDANETLAFGRGYLELRAYNCLPGYLFSDLTRQKAVLCQQNSTWNDSAVAGGCKESCPFLPVVQNSTLDQAIAVVNTTITFTCFTGHVINGNISSVSFKCTVERTWDPSSTLLACKPKVCPVLPVNPHQSMDKKDHIYDTTVTFWCAQGFQLFDNSTIRTIKCLADGQWSAVLPLCLPKKCPDLQLMSRQMRNTSANIFQTYAKYVCDAGYRMLDGSSFKIVFCNAEQEWTDNITDCTPDRCFPLPYVANATPSTTNADYWTASILTCIPGHKFKRVDGEYSMDTMLCQDNGWWNPILTSCEPIYCPPISITGKNLTRNTELRLYGTKVTYSCFKGFYLDLVKLSSSFENQCLETQEWSLPFIQGCHPIKCPPPPPAPSNGVRSTLTSSIHFYAEIVAYSCNNGKKFVNGQRSKNIICNEFGFWNDTDVSCKSERCDSVSILPNSIPDKLNTDWYVVVSYFCKPGYYRPDGLPFFAISCLVGGIWNNTFDASKDCKIKSCPKAEVFQNCTSNSTEKTFYGTTLQYTCQPGFTFPDGEVVKYRVCSEDAIWEPTDFSACDIIYCNGLPNIQNTTKNSNDTHYSSQVTFICLPGFQFRDKSKQKVVTCTENATWTQLPEPCEVVFCPPVPYWTPTIFNTTDNNFLSVVEYHCRESYAFKSSHDQPGNLTTLRSTCEPSKQWQPPIETCYALDAINADIAGKAWESPQAFSLGTIACVLVGIVIAIIFFIDLRKIITDLQLMKQNVNGVLNSRKKNRVRPSD